MKQAKSLYDNQEFNRQILQGVFLQSEICIEEQITTSGWIVVPKKTPVVGYVSLININTMITYGSCLYCINNWIYPTTKYEIFFIS